MKYTKNELSRMTDFAINHIVNLYDFEILESGVKIYRLSANCGAKDYCGNDAEALSIAFKNKIDIIWLKSSGDWLCECSANQGQIVYFDKNHRRAICIILILMNQVEK